MDSILGEETPNEKPNMKLDIKKNEFTVQGVGSPVPASARGEQAGFGTPSSIDRSATVVDNLAAVTYNTTSDTRHRAFERLGKKITELLDYVRPRNNVHGEIKRLVNSVRSCYDQRGRKRDLERGSTI